MLLSPGQPLAAARARPQGVARTERAAGELHRPGNSGFLGRPALLGAQGHAAGLKRTGALLRSSGAPLTRCQAGRSKEQALRRQQAHKIFDEAIIQVKSGRGGEGEIAQKGKGKWVKNFKYRPGSSLPKQVFLPPGDPADGEDGGSVVLYVDGATDSLLHLHEKKRWTAKDGAAGNPAEGSHGARSNRKNKRARKSAPSLRIPVPPGTLVKAKKGALLLGELTNPGDKLVVAHGGRGGIGIFQPSREQKQRERARAVQQGMEEGYDVIEVEDSNWKLDTRGLPGEERKLELTLRVVADVGIVGLPNAGKSSLLRRLTAAKPDVAPYPFTTLMPNLGVMSSDASDSLGLANEAVLADLPGLIEGAHVGVGLGRMFLRHLKRTKIVLHIVDGAAADPASDYWVVREELRMYNPEYCARPHVVAINKMDLEDAFELAEEIDHEIRAMAVKLREDQEAVDSDGQDTLLPSVPFRLVFTSAETAQGLEDLRTAVNDCLVATDAEDGVRDPDDYSWVTEDDVVDWNTALPEDEGEFAAPSSSW